MKLQADAMLGGLARWLRVLGVDTACDPALDDGALVLRARAEGRVLLSRDRRLLERRLARPALFIRSGEIAEQMRQVLGELHIDPDPARFFGRCLRCNRELLALAADEARARVPAFVARTQREFRSCPQCARIYWRATHVRRMEARLAALGLGYRGSAGARA